ncbi:MAG: thymidine kinase [Crocinitomicaceae bacterium]|nr:thymidine kinase [Crocinitomicaceae bacterium]PDH49342.1 MAG: thymidine kinase [Bacteroidetes bacterium MED-G20]|tara:strand:- start:62 stop:643 length:582 start_codon:yes stop_codon:yes gene_type:complete
MFLENNVNHQDQLGWIEVICGSMFSGKTEELIRRLKRVSFANQKALIFKPVTDDRYSKNKVVSHDSKEIESISVHSSTEIEPLSKNVDVIAIDEAQFFDDNIVSVCNMLANNGKRVIVAGLDMDFEGKPFGPMPSLMATAEFVTKVHAICTKTGNLANFSHRISKSKDLVLLGERDEYQPLSRAAFNKYLKND